jgi:D-xylono/L-arabinono-1,4-lactonase
MSTHVTGPTQVTSISCQIGENPLWHPKLAKVLFLDIPTGEIHAYNPADKSCKTFSKGRTTGGMLHHHDGNLLLFQDGAITLLTIEGLEPGKQKILADNQCPGNHRFNDVIADPVGRVYAGTLGGADGKLIRFDLDGKATTLLDGLGVPNGMGFTPDQQHLYFTDSAARKIYLFDYDQTTGNLSHQRTFADIPESQGVPDGMTVDAQGFVWTAIWFGGRLKRFGPGGALEREVHFPVAQTSAITFAGPNLDDIYITSAGTSIADSMAPKNDNHSQKPRGGFLFHLKIPGIKGRPPFHSNISF